MKIAITTLGCKVNQSESASIEGILRNNKYEIVNHTDSPDVCIVNTCTVTAKSDYQSRQMIRRAVKTGAKVIATGCYAQLKPEELSKIDGLDLILGNSQKDTIQEYIDELPLKSPQPPFAKGEFKETTSLVDSPDAPVTLRPYYSSRSRAFLKIQDGCNFSCSYCTVPLARGKSRSLSPQDVLKAVDGLTSDGYKEIVLTGIHIGSYGLELQPESSLLKIVEQIIKSYLQIRIRLSSLEPQEFKNEFLKFIKDGKVCPHLHIPLQSGSDKILRAMKRGYTTSSYKQLINSIVSTCPDISIGTDVITGFPGESDKDFDDTVKFIEQLPVSYLHVFPYSKRPDTKASLLSDHISDKTKKDRVNKLLKISRKKKKAYMASNLDRTLNVIVEKKIPNQSLYNAISDNYLRLFIQSDMLKSGQNLKVRVISMTDNELIAQPLK